MLNKIKTSLVVQTSFLFFISFLVIVLLWIFFYFQQKYQHEQFDTARYFNTASSIQPYIYQNKQLSQKELSLFHMRVYEKDLDNASVVLEKSNGKKGFLVLEQNSRQFLKVYNEKGFLVLEDISTHRKLIAIHLVFMLLLITQGILYVKLQKSLGPISSLYSQLKRLQKGDLSTLDIDSSYEEIKQMINSYNGSVSKIEYMLEMREMFNKIFMHEMKMPLAKGMFYLKQEPSPKTHEKLSDILHGINSELDEFSKIESLITCENSFSDEEHDFVELIDIAKQRIVNENKNINLISCENMKIRGDKEFWILCFKNLLDNALKYSYDSSITIEYEDGFTFVNKGDELPVDITKDIKKWKIEKTKRHKSSTGYGFGLFIIKNIVLAQKYKLQYVYDKNNNEIRLRIYK